MVGTDMFGNASRVVKFAEVLFIKTDRERFDTIARLLTHEGHDCTRVDASGKKSAEWNFRHQTHADRFSKNFNGSLPGFFFVDIELPGEVRLPVTLRFDLPFAPAQPMSGLEFSNRAIGSQWRRDAHEREIVIKRLRLNVSTDIGMKQEGTEFRTEN